MVEGTSARPWETRFLFRVAPLIFVVTVGIGIFNGFHFVELSRAVLLTHVHAGTLGWITIGAFATAFWLVSGSGSGGGQTARWIAIAMTVAVPLYVLAFAVNNFVLRAVFGTPVLVIILVMVAYLIGAIRRTGMSVPALGFILAFTVLVIGSTIGVLYQIQLAAKNVFLPENAIAGHAAAQVGGYLVLFSLSAIEWRLRGATKLGIAGGAQVILLFLGGILVAAGALFNILPLLAIFIPLDIIALVIFLIRIARSALGARWLEASSSRHYAIAVPWVVLNLAVTIYAISIGITKNDFGAIPAGLFISADHAIFIGVITNLVFGMMQDFTAGSSRFWPWAEHVVFWVMNLALVGFVITLLAQVQAGEKFFVPFQGLAILVGIVAYSVRLSQAGPGAPEKTPAAAAAA
jgi:hypothetical protein